MLRRFLNRLIYGGTRHLRPYEQDCLAAWEKNLSSAALAILNRQVARLDLIQRFSKDKIVIFYSADDPSFREWPADSLFPVKGDETCVARVHLSASIDGRRTRINADIILRRGRLSSMEFARPPARSMEIDRDHTTIQTFLDPMQPQRGPQASISLQELTGWVHEWAVQYKAEQFRKPLLSAERQTHLAQIDAVLPDDYLDIIAQTEGMRFSPCVVFGLSEIRRIIRPEANYYILAEIEGKGDLAVTQGQSRTNLVYLDHEDDEPREMKALLRDTLADLIAAAPRPVTAVAD